MAYELSLFAFIKPLSEIFISVKQSEFVYKLKYYNEQKL